MGVCLDVYVGVWWVYGVSVCVGVYGFLGVWGFVGV